MKENELDLPNEIFLDTGVLLNYLYQSWEGDKASPLLETDTIDHVISDTVDEEFESVCERRKEIYPEMLDFLLEKESAIEAFDPDERDTWIGADDRGHIRAIQYQLSDLDDRQEVQRRLRRFVRGLNAQIHELRANIIDEIVEQNPKIGLQFALADVIPNTADVKVVCDAAYWTAEDGGSGYLISLDKEDIVENETAICDALEAEQSDGWRLTILAPTDFIKDLAETASVESESEILSSGGE